MKFFIATALIVNIASAGISDLYHKAKDISENLYAKNITTEECSDFIEGYVDGLMHIYIKGQLATC